MPIVSNEACKAMFFKAGRHEVIPHIFMCAGYDNGGRDSCQVSESVGLAGKTHMAMGCKKEQVRQCLSFCTADFWSWLVYESAVQKPKHCLTSSFLHHLHMAE